MNEHRARRGEASGALNTSTSRAAISGFCASLVGIGLARFAYTPLLPAIIDAHWFDASSAAYLGAANLAGYLAGALLARPLSRVVSVVGSIRSMMVMASMALMACAWPVSFSWFFFWRFVSGFAGGGLMVIAAPTILPHVPVARRGLVGGVIFMGIGAGIAASGTLIPLLLQQGLATTWLGLGALALALTVVAWRGWPSEHGVAPPDAPVTHARGPEPIALRALYIEYALNAAGLVPHMIFLVDFVAHGLGQGVQVGSEFWVLFGLGALVGPVLTGHLADRTGFGPALRLAYFIEAGAVVLPAFGLDGGWLMLSAVVVGAFTPGIVPLTLGRIHELVPHQPAAQKAAWGTATTSFAVLQAIAAYLMSCLFAHRGADYQAIFLIGTAALSLALALDLVVGVTVRGKR
ncbi:YbfB/YjiJ family MFS transporter [Dyella soli]|uniref:YbfB/YjiJ family MFS transporter n=1 Tax=Dyella soli TaxID=522319 RepID=A0A4R0YUK4_9GAMM|nr:YbfB/YjiJ family MFS transporter [Dyella soli]TCI10192.1 YbfB/YjiJ family MFS transporter [Dyella soli]